MGQNTTIDTRPNHEKIQMKQNAISYFTGLAIIPQVHDTKISSSETNYVSTIGLCYERKLSHFFSLRWMNEFELGQYFITVDDDFVERENVFITTILAQFEMLPWLSLFVGPGYEFEKNQSYYVIRSGIAAELNVANDWFVGPEISYDFKQEYQSVSIGLSIIKRF